MSRKFISEELVHQMHSEYEAGSGTNELGAKYGFKGASVYCAFQRYGLPTRAPKEAGQISAAKRSGDKHWRRRNPSDIKSCAYRSQRIVDGDGKVHKRRTHVIVMEQHIGRRLTKDEVVHHINGDKHDNRIENLQLMTRREHTQYEQLLARKTNPERFVRVRGEKGQYLPEPELPWSAYNHQGLTAPSRRKI